MQNDALEWLTGCFGTNVPFYLSYFIIDVLLAHHLLQAIPLTATLLLVDDADQLPSIGPGTVLQDLLGVASVPALRLTLSTLDRRIVSFHAIVIEQS